jgi:hypothetical protein
MQRLAIVSIVDFVAVKSFVVGIVVVAVVAF